MDCSMADLPVHHQLLGFTQTHVYWVGDVIQPSHPLLSPFPPTFNLPQHHGLFKWISSFQPLSRVRLYVTPWTAAHQTSLSITNSETRSDSCPSSWWCHPTISSSIVPFSSCLQSFSASGSFPMSQLFPSGGQTIGISASAAVLPINTQDWFPLLAGSLYYPRDSQESSPTPQIKSINSSVLSFLYGPTLTSIHDYWKNHSFE